MAGPSSRFSDLAWLLVGGAVLLAMLLKWSPASSSGEPPIAVGVLLPPIGGEGWLNVAPGESFDPGGKVVVVDCWATWCGPCRADLPRMAELAAKYRPLGVEFVGVTGEGEADVPEIKLVIAEIDGFVWPVAYGAGLFLDKLNVQAIPTTALFGADGRCRWSGYGSRGLAEALDAELARQKNASAPGSGRG